MNDSILATVFYGKPYWMFHRIFGIGVFLDRFALDFWRILGVILGGFLETCSIISYTDLEDVGFGRILCVALFR